jgi:hypothetical protein
MLPTTIGYGTLDLAPMSSIGQLNPLNAAGRISTLHSPQCRIGGECSLVLKSTGELCGGLDCVCLCVGPRDWDLAGASRAGVSSGDS